MEAACGDVGCLVVVAVVEEQMALVKAVESLEEEAPGEMAPKGWVEMAGRLAAALAVEVAVREEDSCCQRGIDYVQHPRSTSVVVVHAPDNSAASTGSHGRLPHSARPTLRACPECPEYLTDQ